MSPAAASPLPTQNPTTVCDHPGGEETAEKDEPPHFSEVPSTAEPDTDTAPNVKAPTTSEIHVGAAAEHASETPSCLDRPGFSIPVPDNKISARSGTRQPRAPIKPRVILSNKTPLYYFEGVTGYDSVQHRPPSGMYGGRVFSLRAHEGLRPRSSATAPDAGAAKMHFNVSRERTKSSLGSFSSAGWEHSRSGESEEANVNVLFGFEPTTQVRGRPFDFNHTAHSRSVPFIS